MGNEDAVVVTTGVDGLAACAVEVFRRARAYTLYVYVAYAFLFEKPAVGLPKVDVRLHSKPSFEEGAFRGVTLLGEGGGGYTLHREACRPECLIDLIAHLEPFERYAGTDDGMDVVGTDGLHLLNSLRDDASHRATPACMNGSNSALPRVIEQDGNAVGRLDADTEAWLVGNDGIGLFRPSGFAHPADIVGMHLPRQSQVLKPKPNRLHTAAFPRRESREPGWGRVYNYIVHLYAV